MKKYNINELIEIFSKREDILNDNYSTILFTLNAVKERYGKYIKKFEDLMEKTFVYEEKKYEIYRDIREISAFNYYDDKITTFKYKILVGNKDKLNQILDLCNEIKQLELNRLINNGAAVEKIDINKNTKIEDVIYVVEHLENSKKPFANNVKSICKYFKNYDSQKLEAFAKLVREYTYIGENYGLNNLLGKYVRSYTMEPKNKAVEEYIKDFAKKIKIKEQTDENLKNIIQELEM